MIRTMFGALGTPGGAGTGPRLQVICKRCGKTFEGRSDTCPSCRRRWIDRYLFRPLVASLVLSALVPGMLVLGAVQSVADAAIPAPWLWIWALLVAACIYAGLAIAVASAKLGGVLYGAFCLVASIAATTAYLVTDEGFPADLPGYFFAASDEAVAGDAGSTSATQPRPNAVPRPARTSATADGSSKPGEPVPRAAAAQPVATADAAADRTHQPNTPSVKIPVRGANASAYSAPSTSLSYGPWNAVDDDLWTAWHISQAGPGHWIRLDFGRLVVLDRVGIVVGYNKSLPDRYGDRWPLNNRVSWARIIWQGGSVERSFDDTRPLQWTEIGRAQTSWLRIEILAVREGSKWKDTAISEIRCEGRP